MLVENGTVCLIDKMPVDDVLVFLCRSGTKWAHISCALWIPEVTIDCPDKMEPITNISQIPVSFARRHCLSYLVTAVEQKCTKMSITAIHWRQLCFRNIDSNHVT